MTPAIALLGAPVLGAAAPAQKSNPSFFIIILVLGAGFYFFILRPQSQRAKKQRELANQFEVGDEVLTAGGIIGHVLDIQGDRVTLETSVGASFEVMKQYIIRRIDPVAEHDDEVEEEHEHDEDHDHDHDDDHEGHDHDHDHDADADDDHDAEGPTSAK